MHFALHVIGTNFKKTDLENVARVQWSDPDQIHGFLEAARSRFAIEEIFFLQTCNRREFYFYAPELDESENFKSDFIQAVSASMGHQHDPAHFYHHRDRYAVRHIYRVTAGLDSMVLGETEIIKQIKVQSAACLKGGNKGKRLQALINSALSVSKQVRANTNITKNVVSMASLAYRSVTEHLRHRPGKRLVFVGSGHFIQSILPTFTKSQDLDMLFVSRNVPTALAEQYGGQACSLKAFLADPGHFDAMICATAAPHAVFDGEWLHRHAEDSLILDAALPNDVAPEVKEMPSVTYMDLEAMEAVLSKNRLARKAEIPKTEPIFDEATAKLHARWLEFDLAFYNQQISRHYRELGRRALDHLRKDAMPHLEADDLQLLDSWTTNLIGKLTTIPILGLKGVANELGEPAIHAFTRTIASKSPLFKEVYD